MSEEDTNSKAPTSSMPDGFEYDVFMSYSSKDQRLVRPIAERLRKDGIRVWLDKWEIRPGEIIPREIERGLERSRVLVRCISRNALESGWSSLESETFRFRDPLNKDRRFIPLRLDDTPITGSLALLEAISWDPEHREEEYAKLRQACSTRPLVATELSAAEDDIVRQKWRTRANVSALVTLSLLILGIVAAGINMIFLNSHTSARVIPGPDYVNIHVSLTNTGHRSALVKQARLIFDELPIEPVDLDLPTGGVAVPPEGKQVALTVSGLAAKAPRPKIEELIDAGRKVTFRMEVRESNDPFNGFGILPPRDHHVCKDTIPASQIKNFLMRNIPAI